MMTLVFSLSLLIPAEPLTVIASAELLEATLKSINSLRAEQAVRSQENEKILKQLEDITNRLSRIEAHLGTSGNINPDLIQKSLDGLKANQHWGLRDKEKDLKKVD